MYTEENKPGQHGTPQNTEGETNNYSQLYKQLAEQAAELQAILDSSFYVMQAFKAVRNGDGKIIDFTWLFVNKRWKELYGGEMKGKSMLQENPAVIETGLFEKFVHVTETGIPAEFDHYYHHEQFDAWFHQTHAKLGDGFLLTAIDITESKKVQEEVLRLKNEIAQRATDKYYSLFNSIDQGFCIIELLFDENGKAVDYRWLEANPKYEKHSGIKNPIGKLGSEIIPATESYWLENYDKVLKTGKTSRFENWHEATDRWYQTQASRIGDGNSRQIAIVFDDITERKRREQQQEFLLQFSDNLRAERTADAVANKALEMLIEYLRIDRSYMVSYNLDKNIALLDYQIGNETVPPLPDTFDLSHYPEAYKAVLDQTVVIEDDFERQNLSATEKQNSARLGMRAMVAATVRKAEHKPLWSMVAISSTPRCWTPDEVQLVEQVAERTWTAIERAKAEEALKQSEEKYRSLFDSIDEGFVVLEIIYNEPGEPFDIRYIETNKVFKRQTGLDSWDGKTVLELFPNIEPEWLAFYSNVARTGEAARMEYHLGETDHWYTSFASSIGGPGSPLVAVVFDDITERKQLEERQKFLLKLTDTLRPLANPLQIQAAAADLLGASLHVNLCHYAKTDGSFVQIYHSYADGLPASTGKFPLLNLQNGLPQGKMQLCNDIATCQCVSENERAALKLANIGAFVAVPLVKNGKWVATLAVHSIKPRQWKEHEIGLIKEAAERTWAAVERAKVEEALIQSEHRLRKAKEQLGLSIEAGKIGLWHWDVKKDVLQWNKEQEALYGLKEGEFKGGVNDFLKFKYEEDKVEILTLDKVVAMQQADYAEEFRIRRKDGEIRWIHSRSKKWTNDKGEIEYITGINMDITREKKAEEALRQSEQQLRVLLKQKDEFIGIASHELKTPVTSMLVYADIVQEALKESGNYEQAELLGRLSNQIDRLSSLINHLLDTTKISEGRLKLEIEPVDINTLIRQRMEEIGRTTRHGFKFEEHSLPVVMVDKERMGQVLTNLLSNAIKYSPNTSVITIKSQQVHDYIEVSVEDHGYGISEEDQQKIFDRFYRVTANKMDSFPGMGLGLYITAQIIHQHGGTLQVKSILGQGSIFSFRLPVKSIK
ncbi:MAG: PAS domain S-box protein [Chitinophagaceae bacterium]|nr:PAS domain S-box protein [Chitinophagaceae bacterium]